MFVTAACFFAVTLAMQHRDFCVADVDVEIVRAVTIQTTQELGASGSVSYTVLGSGQIIVLDGETPKQEYVTFQYFHESRYLAVYTTFDRIHREGFE